MRTLWTIAVVLTLAVAAAGQDAPPPAEPRFFIEKIEVRNAKRVSTDIVIAESRLRAGQEYTEAELADAAVRLERLPFLVSVDFSLDKGSERGRYVLVMTISETKPFFYLLDMRPIGGDIIDVDYSDRLGASENQASVGLRWFLGRRGMAHVGLVSRNDNRDFTRDYTAIVAGYTQYDLFGTRAFVTLNLKRPVDVGGAGPSVSPQIVAGIPLSPNQTLTLTYDETRFSRGTVGFGEHTFEHRDDERMLSARWSYNTTNDPFLPTEGLLLTFSPLVAQRDSAGGFYFVDGEGKFHVETETEHLNSVGFDFSAARWIELSEKDSIVGGIEGGWGDVDVRNSQLGRPGSYESNYWTLHGGYSRSLWNRERQKKGDSRLEATLRYTNRNGGGHRRYAVYQQDYLQVSGSWVRRSSWGTFRVGLGYAW